MMTFLSRRSSLSPPWKTRLLNTPPQTLHVAPPGKQARSSQQTRAFLATVWGKSRSERYVEKRLLTQSHGSGNYLSACIVFGALRTLNTEESQRFEHPRRVRRNHTFFPTRRERETNTRPERRPR